MTKSEVLTSMKLIDKPFFHVDSRAFPDDTAWFGLFEKYVLKEDSLLQLYCWTDECKGESMLLPLIRRYRRMGIVSLEAMQNYYTVDFRPICSSVDARDYISLAIASIVNSKEAHVVNLKPMDSSAPETKLIRDAFIQADWQLFQSYYQANWVHNIYGTYEDYLASRGSRLRNTIKRKTKRLFAMSNVELTIFDGKEKIDELIESYCSVYENSWKAEEPFPNFMPALIREIADRGQLRLGVLKMNGTPVAVHFWIVKFKQAYIYKLAHDSSYDQYSPGTVLMAEMIKHVLEKDGVNRLNFLSGDDDYKKDWMDDRLMKVEITAYNSKSFLGRLARLIDKYILPLPTIASRMVNRTTSVKAIVASK